MSDLKELEFDNRDLIEICRVLEVSPQEVPNLIIVFFRYLEKHPEIVLNFLTNLDYIDYDNLLEVDVIENSLRELLLAIYMGNI